MAITREDVTKWPLWMKGLILAGCVLVVGLAWYFFLLAPKQEEISKLNGELKKIGVEIKKYEEAKRTKIKLMAQIRELENELKVLSAKLPEEKEIPALLSTVTELGRLNGLQFALFRQRAAVRKEYYSEIPVEIQVEGGFHQVSLFLYRVGTMDRILHVSDLRMGKYKALEVGGLLEASVTATTYKYETEPLTQKKTDRKRRK